MQRSGECVTVRATFGGGTVIASSESARRPLLALVWPVVLRLLQRNE